MSSTQADDSLNRLSPNSDTRLIRFLIWTCNIPTSEMTESRREARSPSTGARPNCSVPSKVGFAGRPAGPLGPDRRRRTIPAKPMENTGQPNARWTPPLGGLQSWLAATASRPGLGSIFGILKKTYGLMTHFPKYGSSGCGINPLRSYSAFARVRAFPHVSLHTRRGD